MHMVLIVKLFVKNKNKSVVGTLAVIQSKTLEAKKYLAIWKYLSKPETINICLKSCGLWGKA